jgi:hypothetical protein
MLYHLYTAHVLNVIARHHAFHGMGQDGDLFTACSTDAMQEQVSSLNFSKISYIYFPSQVSAYQPYAKNNLLLLPFSGFGRKCATSAATRAGGCSCVFL